MIGFNCIGRLGRLGNQMFQYAALRGIAFNRGFNFCFPVHQNTVNDGSGNILKTELFDGFEMNSVSPLNIQLIDNSRKTITEKSYSFDENLFNNCPDWTNIHGFFQSEKYFKHIRNTLLEDFKFKDEILNPCKKMISSVDKPISLHIRRTDYLTNPNHTVLGLDYYEKALKEFDDDSTIIVFSDDPAWCSEQKLFYNDRFLIAEGNDQFVDMCLMTMCSGHIIANSSFSWWGAWLSNSKKIIAPSGWFDGSNNLHLDTSDLIPKEWMVI